MNRLPNRAWLLAIVAWLAASAVALRGQTTAPTAEKLDFGADGLVIPSIQVINAHSPRTAQLLGEAYRRHEPLVWKRAQCVAELGLVALPAASPYVIEAIKDPAPQVRAQAARSAALIGDVSLLADVEK